MKTVRLPPLQLPVAGGSAVFYDSKVKVEKVWSQ